jgi:hypothetical protein
MRSEIEQHVTNLEFSMKLKALGYPQQSSLFYWVKEVGTQNWHIAYRERFDLEICITDEIAIAAPLASELLRYFAGSYVLKIAQNLHDDWIVEANNWLVGAKNFKVPPQIENLTVNAIAKSIIWLVENGHVKFNDFEPTTKEQRDENLDYFIYVGN